VSGRIDISAQRFERLVVLGYSHTRNKKAYWKCRCDCGRVTIILGSSLRNGHTRSCGCFKLDQQTNHGESNSPLYQIWIARTHSEHGCCLEWGDYETFRQWALKHGWKQGLWVHRRGDKGVYSPSNCYIGPHTDQYKYGVSETAKVSEQQN